MLSVWIDFGLKMRGLKDAGSLASFHVRPTTETAFTLVNLLFGKLGA